ncbi:MAG: Gfo/Idh/MocA family protein [Planctomycetota bacterium]|jgi:predicted dehydrogenase
MAAKRLGVLVHGAGWVSTQHIDAFKANPHTEIVAISSRTVEGATKRARESGLDVACYDDYAKALAHEGVDIVSVCTPQHLHPDNTIAAARAGKHIVIEKPVAMTLPELTAMREAVDRAGVKTVVSFVLRWNPLFQTLKRMAADNAFGRVYYVEADYQSHCGDWWSGYRDGRTRERGGSAFLVGGCHAVDAVRWFASGGEFEAAEAVEVFAYHGGVRGSSPVQYDPTANAWHEGEPLEYPGLEVAMVRFSNGALGKVSVNFECIQPYALPIEIFGDRGSVKDNRIWSHKYPGQKGWVELPTVCPDSSDVTHHPFQSQMDHFVDCILHDRESHCNLADAAKTHEIVFAAERCYKTRRPVALPLA